MAIHFEELWEKCEKLHQEESGDKSECSAVLEELAMKIKLYSSINEKPVSDEELKAIKSRLMGEILLTMTNLSLVDNINVFDALMMAYNFRSVSLFSKKYE